MRCLQIQGLTTSKLAEELAVVLNKEYPTKGRLTYIENDVALVNIGKKENVFPGDLFRVLAEPEAIVFKGETIGFKKAKQVAQIRISRSETDKAYGVILNASGDLTDGLRVQQIERVN